LKNKKTETRNKKKEICWNIVNSLLAGGLVFFGSLVNGFSWEGLGFAFATSMVTAIIKFQDYWKSKQNEYSAKLLNFVGV